MVNETSALGDSPAFLGSPGDLDCFGLACTVANTDARKSNGREWMWQGVQALSVVDITSVLAESTTGVKLAGGAEKVPTAKPEALEPWAYGKPSVKVRRCCEKAST